MELVKNVVCPFCGTLCDDIICKVEGDEIVGTINACRIGHSKFVHAEGSELMTVINWMGHHDFDDGTDDNLSAYKGKPVYAMANAYFSEWESNVPCVSHLINSFTLESHNPIPVISLIKLIDMIKTESDASNDLDRNRAQWLHFWSHKAIEVFGDRAMIDMSF